MNQKTKRQKDVNVKFLEIYADVNKSGLNWPLFSTVLEQEQEQEQ